MKIASPLCIAIAMAALSFAVSAQETPSQSAAGGAQHHREAPAPTNLKVLPKNMTGEQVHEVMHKWAGELGTECTTCHAVDPNRKMPNGRPAMNFADDSKPEKKTARLMLRMVEDINKNYLSKVEDHNHEAHADHAEHEAHAGDHEAHADHDKGHNKEEAALSCGTCHRGHVHPPTFTPPKEDHDHDHPAPQAKP